MIPEWLTVEPYARRVQSATSEDVVAALNAIHPAEAEFAALISPAATPLLEALAGRSRALTRGHFGKTVSLYAPLYLSNYCPGGCAYCGFASDRKQPRHRLTMEAMGREIEGLKAMGMEDVLLLTGERCSQADFTFLHSCAAEAGKHFHNVSVEAFAMTTEEYAALEQVGCTGVTLYQETYDPEVYARLHRWGEKQDFAYRLDAPSRALTAGLRTVGIGALLGLADPQREMLSLFRHAKHLQKRFWRSGVMVSFPRICHEVGSFSPDYTITDRQLVQYILAFRICLPDVPLVLSTRESAAFRDGMAGIGISRMSVASRTTVGGYGETPAEDEGQFDVQDVRDVRVFCDAMRSKGLEPVFKNWDTVFQSEAGSAKAAN
ncbi:MAG: 2-iminoacetate synthase ThiH [Verrucomicrobia bacterium]|jgi:2-iminoacetate synthase|nr:2-iminoacetate synthase ThiH [Verrucomicrobiota bacterium]